MATFTATCETEGCSNAGIPIELEYDPEMMPGAVMCGVCGQFITGHTLDEIK